MAQNKFKQFLITNAISLISLFGSAAICTILFIWQQQSSVIVTAQTIKEIQTEQTKVSKDLTEYKTSQEKHADAFKVELKSIREEMATKDQIDDVKKEQYQQRDMIIDIWKSRVR